MQRTCPAEIGSAQPNYRESRFGNVTGASETLRSAIRRLGSVGKASLGEDIDEAHIHLLDKSIGEAEKRARLLDWIARFQPCLFGRVGAKGARGIVLDVCWVNSSDIDQGEDIVRERVQSARKSWKERAGDGLSSAFLVMINDPELAAAPPSRGLVEVTQRIAALILPEKAPIQPDTIYTEAVPLKTTSGWTLFKAGVNVFYSSAHRTENHDRRVPGGMLFSVNSPGHLANSLAARRLRGSLEEAVEDTLVLAVRSIGRGGIGHSGTPSASWHNTARSKEEACPAHLGLPSGVSRTSYSARYHTDVLIPSREMSNEQLDPEIHSKDVWSDLVLSYISLDQVGEAHLNYGLYRGHPISESERFTNPWAPRKAARVEIGDAKG